VGVNATVSTSDSPGSTVLPSGSEVVAANSPPLGGFDLVIVTAVPPVFVTVNDLVAVVPAATAPYSTCSPVICRSPGAPALPESAIAALPALVSSPISPL
jgi:hypothetical protein